MSNSKKYLSKVLLLTVAFVLIFLLVPKVKTAKAMELTNDEYDRLFIQTIEEYIGDNYNSAVELIANKEIIYDIELNKFGYIYDFTLNGQKGYATVVDSRGYPELTEVYFDSLNPFLNGGNYYRIYIGNSIYAFYNDNSYYVSSGDKISEDEVELLKDIAYYSNDPNITSSSETIYYITKVVDDEKQLALRYPSIDMIDGHSNGCVPIAGANIIQYWDRFLPNLIENYTPGLEVGTSYIYYKPTPIVYNVGNELYDLMGTNEDGGATIYQFKSGMTKYCSNRGYKISYESCMSLGKFNYSKAKEKINIGHPVVLFVDPFALATITSNDNSDLIQYYKINMPHTMVGFGYKDIKYTLTNGLIRTDNYIEVASGMIEYSNGYYNINYETIIDDAYGVYIS